MTTWQIILFPIGLIVVGLVRQIFILHKKHVRLNLVREFLKRFIEWFNNKGQDSPYERLFNFLKSPFFIRREFFSGLLLGSDRENLTALAITSVGPGIALRGIGC